MTVHALAPEPERKDSWSKRAGQSDLTKIIESKATSSHCEMAHPAASIISPFKEEAHLFTINAQGKVLLTVHSLERGKNPLRYNDNGIANSNNVVPVGLAVVTRRGLVSSHYVLHLSKDSVT